MKKRIAVLLAFTLLLSGMVGLTTAAAAVEIVNIQVTEVSAAGYRVTATLSTGAGISRVLMPTWTEANGQDDLVWHQASVSGNTATFMVRSSDHRSESGSYITHIYVYDTAGGYTLRGVNVSVPSGSTPSQAPVITSAEVTEVTSSGYLVTARFTAGAGVAEVLMPTWTEANGQDDLVWHRASVSGNTATFRVAASDHRNETGKYITHIYVKDTQGRQAPVVAVNADVKAAQPSVNPSVSNVQTVVKSDRITVTATVSAPAGISRVLMPTWTEANGQDDLVWHQATVSGNTASCDIMLSGHRNETGKYITHVYVYDNAGRFALQATESQVPQAAPEPSAGPVLRADRIDVTGLSSAGYTVTVTFTSTEGISKVEMPTWTEANGQDDLIWHQASISGNTATFTVRAADHKNESGKYITHVYLYDRAGNRVIEGSGATVPAPSSGGNSGGGGSGQTPSGTKLQFERVETSEITDRGFRLTVYFTAEAGVDRVIMPSWTEANGQDDLVWHQAAVSGNSATCYIPVSDHGNGFGNYTTHIYVYDKTGNSISRAKTTFVPAPGTSVPSTDSSSGGPIGTGSLEITNLRLMEITSSGFWVLMKINAPNGYSKVSTAAWSVANGQDDVAWHDMVVTSDGTAAVYIPTAAHNGERGQYLINAYLFENDYTYQMKFAFVMVP